MSAVSRSALLALFCLSLFPIQAAAWDRGHVDRFARLPEGAANPEGITVGRHGDVYVTIEVAGSSNLLLGVAFHPMTDELLVVDSARGTC